MVSEPWTDIPWKGTFNYDRGYIYFRNVGNRLLLGGGRNEAVEEESVDQFGSNPVIKKYLRRFARETLQMPKEINFEHQWSGIMGFTPTKTPVIKRLDEHRVVAAGLSGMGIAIGMDVGKQAAGLLSNK
jgi:glycine/D-amino acid oxidase-like deaminating enzyme